MPTSFPLNIVKMFAFSAVLALIMSFAGRQAGFITYGLLNPPDERPTFNEPVSHYKKIQASPLPATLAQTKPKAAATKPKPVPAMPKPAPIIVKKSVPIHRTGPTSSSPIKPVSVIQETPNKSPKPGIKPKIQSDPAPLLNVIELNAGAAKLQAIDTSGVYAIQTGVFTDRKNAEENSQTFRLKGYSPSTVILTCDDCAKVYAIRIGRFEDKAEAKTAFANFRKRESKDALLVPLYSKQDLMSFCKKK